MSVPDSPTAAQADAVLREAQALAAALDRGKTTRRVILLVFVVFVVLIGGTFYRLFARLKSDAYLNDLQAAAMKQLQGNTEFSRHATGLVTAVRPHVEKAITDQLKKDSPAYLQSMQAQADVFATNLQAQLQAKLDDFHDKAILKNRAMVEAEFPAAKDPKVQERLVANMHTAIEGLAKKYYVDEMRKSMQDLYQHWDEIPAALPATKDVPSIEDQLFATLFELLRIRLTQPTAPPA